MRNIQFPKVDHDFELTMGQEQEKVTARIVQVGECKNLNEVKQKIAEKGYRPLEGDWCKAFHQKFARDKEYGLTGFIGSAKGPDHIFPYISNQGIKNSHCNWAKGTFLDFWFSQLLKPDANSLIPRGGEKYGYSELPEM